MTPQDKLALFKKLVAQAEAEHSQYPRYSNHWHEWQIGRVTKEGRLTTHNLPGFMPGDIVLVKPTLEHHEPFMDYPGGDYRIAYLPAHPERGSFESGCDAYIPVDSIEIIG